MAMLQRPADAPPALHFGRRKAMAAAQAPASSLADDLKLFMLTFAGGFLFMSVYLA